jgi:hypothetical protein
MSDELSIERIAGLRTRKATLESEVRKLESQFALVEKQLEARDDAATKKRFDEVEGKLSVANDELQRVTDELEAAEAARAEHAATTDELERLVDSFSSVAKDVPELGELLAAMKLCVGALATARRLERKNESLTEAKDISRALNEALLRLASTMSTRAKVLSQL